MSDQLREAIDSVVAWAETSEPTVIGYYLDGDAGQPNPETVYCYECGDRAARLLERISGVRTVAVECWAGDDRLRRCPGCDTALDTGGLTDHAVDEAITDFARDQYLPSPAECGLLVEAVLLDDERLPLLLQIAELARAMEVSNVR